VLPKYRSEKKTIKREDTAPKIPPRNEPESKEREVIASKLGIATFSFKKMRKEVPSKTINIRRIIFLFIFVIFN
jgi:hypothetical protein